MEKKIFLISQLENFFSCFTGFKRSFYIGVHLNFHNKIKHYIEISKLCRSKYYL